MLNLLDGSRGSSRAAAAADAGSSADLAGGAADGGHGGPAALVEECRRLEREEATRREMLVMLREMGFSDESLNCDVLAAAGGDAQKAICLLCGDVA